MEGYLVELALNEPKRSVDKAIAFYRATGKEIALAEFANPNGRFAQGEQYLYVLDISGMMLAHPVNQHFIGKDFYRVNDPEGKSFIKEIVDTANNEGFGWVEYTWFDPVTGTEQPKTVYFEKVDNMIFCSGVYGLNPAVRGLGQGVAEHIDHLTHEETASESISSAGDILTRTLVEEEELELVQDDAKRWVDRAIVFHKANGNGVALAEFSSPRGRFVRDGQYVFVLDINGTMLAHPVNEKYLNKDFYRIKDSDGKSFIQEIVDTANEKGSGWVEYKWFNPATKREQLKTVYFKKVDNKIFCSGVYLS